MTVTLPRLDRRFALEFVERYRHAEASDREALLPALDAPVTYAPVGGARLQPNDPLLPRLRANVLALARHHGMPGPMQRRAEFEGECAGLIHATLDITPHEASSEEAWSYITCCWLLDVAIWRWGGSNTVERYIGHVNRNTFRRMWWRAEVLGPDIDLTQLGEDEFTALMERPTIASDRRVARAITKELLARVGAGRDDDRMQLVRDTMKRILRLTPFVAFDGLDDAELRRVVAEAFDCAEAALSGRPTPQSVNVPTEPPEPSPQVAVMTVITGGAGENRTRVRPPRDSGSDEDFETVCEVALQIARSTGRVANAALRDAASITSDEARGVLGELVKQGALVRRGAKRGTHYVIAADPPTARRPQTDNDLIDEGLPSRESPLRRFLKRGR